MPRSGESERGSMKLPESQTNRLMVDITNAAAQYICGQRLVRRHLDDETASIIHQGHVNVTAGIESLRDGEPIEIGLGKVAAGAQLLQQGYKAAEQSVLATEQRLNAHTNGLALMKDALDQLSHQLEIFQPLLEDVKNR